MKKVIITLGLLSSFSTHANVIICSPDTNDPYNFDPDIVVDNEDNSASVANVYYKQALGDDEARVYIYQSVIDNKTKKVVYINQTDNKTRAFVSKVKFIDGSWIVVDSQGGNYKCL